MRHHGFRLLDRGGQHRHRWKPICACGWVGVPRRRKQEAVEQHHDHLGALIRQSRHPVGLFPKPPTPVELLPDALRPTIAPDVVAPDPNPR